MASSAEFHIAGQLGDGYKVVMNPLTEEEFNAAFNSLKRSAFEKPVFVGDGSTCAGRAKRVIYDALSEVTSNPSLKEDTRDVAKDFDVFKAVFCSVPMQKLIRREMQDEGFAGDSEETTTVVVRKEKEVIPWIFETLLGAAKFFFELVCAVIDIILGDILGMTSKNKIKKITNAFIVAISTIIRAILSRLAVVKSQKGALFLI